MSKKIRTFAGGNLDNRRNNPRTRIKNKNIRKSSVILYEKIR